MNSLLKELEGVLEDKDKVNIIKVSKPIVLGKGSTLEYKNGVIIV